MLEFLSHLKSKFGYTAELIPLAPGHAWNRTDARIAHMNIFLKLDDVRVCFFSWIFLFIPPFVD